MTPLGAAVVAEGAPDAGVLVDRGGELRRADDEHPGSSATAALAPTTPSAFNSERRVSGGNAATAMFYQ
jgi:hypothetical protein